MAIERMSQIKASVRIDENRWSVVEPNEETEST